MAWQIDGNTMTHTHTHTDPHLHVQVPKICFKELEGIPEAGVILSCLHLFTLRRREGAGRSLGESAASSPRGRFSGKVAASQASPGRHLLRWNWDHGQVSKPIATDSLVGAPPLQAGGRSLPPPPLPLRPNQDELVETHH